MNLVELELAEKDIKEALEIDPDNRDVKLEYKVLKDKVKEYNRKEAQFYGSIFAKMSKTDQARSAGAAAKQGAASMAIDRLRRLILGGGLAEKALQTVDLVRSEGIYRLWLISLLIVLVAVVVSVLYMKK
ncbi:Peptidylprolyl isomerase [Handroanthus impetiginosus]|uniref:Peptidylprolyl isomerase n=1 Tax=Handroanthus impetiginosus TaxID=429701 RepID=A0A2G9I6X6_9LAMI|nr:Peptidylprolyl isomerase [Handroanthus impetiginosus]